MTTQSPDTSQEITLQPQTTTPPKTKETARYRCDICAKAFTRSATLAHHVRTHTGERPFQCSSCSKGFARLKDMKRHELLHSTERKFVCQGVVDVSGEDVDWGCGRKFARQDGLVAHLRSILETRYNFCFFELAYELRLAMSKKDWKYPKYLLHQGIWTCQFNGPSNLSKREAIPTGCGRKFEGAKPLRKHLADGGSQWWRALDWQAQSDAMGLVVARASHIPHNREELKPPKRLSSSCQNLRIHGSTISFWDIDKSTQVILGMPPEIDSWRPFDLDIGGTKITNFRMRKYDGTIYISGNVYELLFIIPDAPCTIDEDAPIILRANLVGDCNSYSYDKMILGVFKSKSRSTTPQSVRANGKEIVSRKGVWQLISQYDGENIGVTWSNGELELHFLKEVSVTRVEQKLW
ncbi:DNA-binding transcription factor, variant 2 [Cadophora gregata]|nr:DNA-binding transcription factor, variant 2 [Cadophora gregata]KAK0100165.1 DNA-binding transcription factor, variant 2 [Cadophora gregata]KAK0114890.1 DNA-binding transcription factor [Cadophora gregata f. sp. sojae]